MAPRSHHQNDSCINPFTATMLLERIFIKRHTIESRLLEDWKIYCLQASRCIFQPGNFTGCGSEGVNVGSDESQFNASSIVRD